MVTNKQSYNIGNFNDEEIQRLIQQGSATWSYEKKFLLNSGLKSYHKVLDIGCGPGIFSFLIWKDILDEKGEITGVDQDISLINSEIKNVARLNFHKNNAYDLKQFYNQYDFVILRLVLQHIKEPKKILEQAYKCIKKSGKIFILDSDDSLFNILPEHKKLPKLLNFSQNKQMILGGDRFIGKKIGFYLNELGFSNIESDIFLITPMKCGGINNFINISLGFRDKLAEKEELQDILNIKNEILEFYEKKFIYGQNGSYVWSAEKIKSMDI